jgi:5-methylthioadenosine/S-adenosylhomocysteine deaminase
MLRIFSLLFAGLFALTASLPGAERADLIITARYVVTVDPSNRIIDDGAIAVRGADIAGVGARGEILKQFTAGQVIARPNAIVMPGLINTHTHAAMSLLRGIADDLALQDWLERFIFPAEAKNVTPEFVEWGTKLACMEMLLSGTTTITDMYYFEDVAARAVKASGMRGVMGQTILRFPVPDAKNAELGLTHAEGFLKQFQNDEWITPAVAPHAIYTNTDETLQACRRLADKYKVPIVIHVSETEKEVIDSKAQRGGTPVQVLERLGIFQGPTIAAHCVWVNADDETILASHHVGAAHCPSSNMKLASGAAPVASMVEKRVAVGLGTDGPAGSNNDFNMMEEMDLAGKLSKLVTRDPRALPARVLIEMATINGARAIGLDRKIGSLEAGKRADMITLSLDHPNAIPLYDVPSQIVYALKGSDVRDVWINGRQVVRDREVLTLNRDEVYSHARALSRKVRDSLGMK